MVTYRPSCTVAPVTRVMASAASPEPAREMSSALMASLTAGAFWRSLSSAASVLRRARASTTTASTSIASDFRVKSRSTTPSASTTTSVIVVRL